MISSDTSGIPVVTTLVELFLALPYLLLSKLTVVSPRCQLEEDISLVAQALHSSTSLDTVGPVAEYRVPRMPPVIRQVRYGSS